MNTWTDRAQSAWQARYGRRGAPRPENVVMDWLTWRYVRKGFPPPTAAPPGEGHYMHRPYELWQRIMATDDCGLVALMGHSHWTVMISLRRGGWPAKRPPGCRCVPGYRREVD